MSRYVYGRRTTASRRGFLKLENRPPVFYATNDRETLSWPGAGLGWTHKRGVIQEWRDDWGRPVVARVFNEAFAEKLKANDDEIARLKLELETAEAHRQELLENAVSASEPLRIKAARKEREEWPNTEEGKREKELHDAEYKRVSEAMRR